MRLAIKQQHGTGGLPEPHGFQVFNFHQKIEVRGASDENVAFVFSVQRDAKHHGLCPRLVDNTARRIGRPRSYRGGTQAAQEGAEEGGLSAALKGPGRLDLSPGHGHIARRTSNWRFTVSLSVLNSTTRPTILAH